MGRFFDFVQSFSDSLPQLLPLTHVADMGQLDRILQSGTLELPKDNSPCMDEPRLFAFYGRMAYRIHGQDDGRAHNVNIKKPICVLLHPDLLQEAASLYPFDTGAFIAGIFNDWFSSVKDQNERKQTCRNYELQPNADIAARFVVAFFGTNEAYNNSNPLITLKKPATCADVNAYFAMIQNQGPSKEDDRSSTLEVSFTKIIEMNKKNILCVVLPDDGRGIEYITDALKRNDIPFASYYAPRSHSSEFTGALRQKIKDIYADELKCLKSNKHARLKPL